MINPAPILYSETVNFRELKAGSLVELAKGAQPVIFEGISNRKPHDLVKIVCLDPVEGLSGRIYAITEGGYINNCLELQSGPIDTQSEEGRKYLEVLMGGNHNGKNT